MWLVPKDPKVKDSLTNDIVTLSKQLEKENIKCETFSPHVTLLSFLSHDLESITKHFEKIIKDHNIVPFQLKTEKVSYSNTYFQCVFLEIQKGDDLLKLHSAAYDVLCKEDHHHLSPKTAFRPHLSLIYSDLSKQDRPRYVKEAENLIPNNFQFTVDQIQVWVTDSQAVNTWELIGTIPFSNPP